MKLLPGTLILAISLHGCKDESNPKKVEYNGPIALRTNYARPSVFKVLTRSSKDIDCASTKDLVPREDGSQICARMDHAPEGMQSALANMARFILTKRDPFEVNGREAGTVVDRITKDIISLHQNRIEVERDGPDVCIKVVSANVAFVKNDAFAGVLAAKHSILKPNLFPLRWMTFDVNFYLYNFVDFTDQRVVTARLMQEVPELLTSDWSIKASRHFSVRVCRSTIDNSVIQHDGVILKISTK